MYVGDSTVGVPCVRRLIICACAASCMYVYICVFVLP